MLDLSVAKKVESSIPGVEAAFEIEPAAMYPMVASHLADLIERGGSVPANLTQHLEEARAVGVEALDFIGLPVEFTPDAKLPNRAAALEVCRRFFTEALHASVGYAKMHVRILKDEAYRLK